MIEIKHATIQDVDAIEKIAQNNSHNPWNKEQIQGQLNYDFAHVLIAKKGDETVGFCLFHLSDDGAHINEIATEKAHRRCGIGGGLISRVEKQVEKNKSENITLEVRKQDKGAVLFYQSLGFSAVGERKQFYKDPVDDALVMKKTVGEKAG